MTCSSWLRGSFSCQRISMAPAPAPKLGPVTHARLFCIGGSTSFLTPYKRLPEHNIAYSLDEEWPQHILPTIYDTHATAHSHRTHESCAILYIFTRLQRLRCRHVRSLQEIRAKLDAALLNRLQGKPDNSRCAAGAAALASCATESLSISPANSARLAVSRVADMSTRRY